MAEKIGLAGLPDRGVTHGLRKAAARRLAEAGCTTLQTMAITGQGSLQEVERYSRETAHEHSAQPAIVKFERRTGVPQFHREFGKIRKKISRLTIKSVNSSVIVDWCDCGLV
jgi:hypothetical protein